MNPAEENILQVEGLATHFETARGTVRAVDGVDLSVRTGDTVGIVGESGCGKTVLALSIMRLVPPPGRITAGSILFGGRDLLALPEEEMRRIRGREISMIFQEPMTSLNPVFRVGDQVAEVLEVHERLPRRKALERVVEVFRLVGIPSPESRIRDYPHQLSGGLRQRVMIAMALCLKPRLMLADEPTTALDVTIQAQILDLIGRLKAETGTSVLLVTHDLGVVAEAAQFVAVMYAGIVVEYGTVADVFATPCHPYTAGLLASVPRARGTDGAEGRLPAIAGTVPSLDALPMGCRFSGRCPEVMEICRREEPAVTALAPGRRVRCWKCS
ncbi:MAG: peptide ABC transporter ATP-binding protein [Deltaproteobacteria bacterium HGW-Deltaproteobacteria-19]|nr:MAG: peptide ABC transporter ATP-binding protein [Deltaproteobacteria bacterium HGW-Deltaproteobacteria-19]